MRSSTRAGTDGRLPAEAPGDTDWIVPGLAQGGFDAPEVGVGAHHRQFAAERLAQQRLVVIDPIVPSCRPGIEDELSLLNGLDILEFQALADIDVALGADMEAAPAERRIKRIVIAAPEM